MLKFNTHLREVNMKLMSKEQSPHIRLKTCLENPFFKEHGRLEKILNSRESRQKAIKMLERSLKVT
jgi:hypothetical protein